MPTFSNGRTAHWREAAHPIASDYALLLKLSRRTDLRCEMIEQTLVTMRIGGLLTGGAATNARTNREILAVLCENGLHANPILIWSKYLAKIGRIVGRPADLPRGWRAPI